MTARCGATEDEIKAHAVWRAALEWVMMHKQEYEACVPNECWEYIDLNPIEKELEDK